jgi:hypothetical protein
VHPFWHGSVRVTTGGQARGPNTAEHAQRASPQPAGQYGYSASSCHDHNQPSQEEGEYGIALTGELRNLREYGTDVVMVRDRG